MAIDLITRTKLGLEGEQCIGAYIFNPQTGAVDVFRQQTGINPATPSVTKKGNNFVIYSTSLEKEIRTNIMKAMFNTLSLEVVVTPLPNIIGGYSFLFRFKFMHPFGKQETLESGTVLFKNNKFTAQF